MTSTPDDVALCDLTPCFEGAVPAVVATASADGIPNVTYLSRVHAVDDHHIALSNQFFSKTVRNLAENPRASILLIDPTTYHEFRMTVVYERTERRGPIFERLRDDVDALAELSGLQDVFRLRAADIYRVLHIDRFGRDHRQAEIDAGTRSGGATSGQLAEFAQRVARSADLDVLVSTAVRSLATVFAYEHSMLMLVDESSHRLFTIASHGYETEGVGSEIAIGEGIVGMAAARGTPIRLGNLRQMEKYSRTVRRSFEDQGEVGPGLEVPVPGLPGVNSRVAVPILALGQVVGVLVVESTQSVAFDQSDEETLTVVASLLGHAIEMARLQSSAEPETSRNVAARAAHVEAITPTHVRFFAVDGSTFLDGDYLIKGVAGRILWSLLKTNERDGRVEFTNKEVRLDPTLAMPEYRDNFESRLILLKRRLEERHAPIQIEKSGRGRFRLVLHTPLRLECVDEPT
jgi:predicted pyridoxine 5'-phosphate oxidase superfamily flavin-nucleotide-binding protein